MTKQKTQLRRLGDKTHFVSEDYLPGGAKLHHFKNEGGADLSAIYFRDIEVYWCYVGEEEDMLKEWERDWKEVIPVLERQEC